MVEENQVMMKGVKENQVTTNNPKTVEVGRRLTKYNHKKREELNAQKSEELKAQKSEELKSEVSQYFSVGTVLAVGVIGGLSYYLYQAKANNVVPSPPQQPRPQAKKLEME